MPVIQLVVCLALLYFNKNKNKYTVYVQNYLLMIIIRVVLLLGSNYRVLLLDVYWYIVSSCFPIDKY